VLAIAGGRWSISASGTDPWQTLNPKLSTRLDSRSVLIADVNGNGTDDVVRFTLVFGGQIGSISTGVKWEVSWEGRGDWQTLRVVRLASTKPPEAPEADVFAGRFDDSPGADLLVVDRTRFGRLYSKATDTIVTHNLYAY